MPLWACLSLAAGGVAAAGARALHAPSAREVAARYRSQLATSPAVSVLAFHDVTSAVGVDFVHDADAHGRHWLPEEMGPGVALFDADGDGDLDLAVGGGGSVDRTDPSQPCRLWLNQAGHFQDATDERLGAVAGPVFGLAAADYDDDGDLDLFVGRLGANALLRNDGERFTEVAAAAGVDDPGFATAAVWFDYYRYGRIDLYVGNYVDWSPAVERRCYAAGVPDYCDPSAYQAPGQDRLYHNLDGTRFADVTASAGMLGQRGHALGAVAEDFDDDGHVDLYVANDALPAKLWRNHGDGTFTDDALHASCAYNALGVAIAGMGVACEDLDGDLRLDLLVTNIRSQSHLALLSRDGRFEDHSAALGLPAWSTPWTGFGVALFDADHDGELDGYVANGAVNLAPNRVGEPRPYAEPDQVVRFEGGRTRAETASSGSLPDEASRALATGDLDADGDLDVVVSAFNGRLRVLRNEQPGNGHWLLVDARTARGAPALGARVEVEVGGRRRVRVIRAQSSYLASSDPRAHFGLGSATRVDEIVVRWPDGSRTRRVNVATNHTLVLRHGDP